MEIVFDSDGCQIPVGGNGVTASFSVTRQADGSHVIVIEEWSSYNPGKGYTNQALQILKDRWPGIIIVKDCGWPGDPGNTSINYWGHQLSKGLIDQAFDDEGNEVRHGN